MICDAREVGLFVFGLILEWNLVLLACIRNDYEDWYRHKLDSMRRTYGSGDESEHRRERIASLDVMGISALEGTGVRAAVDWLFIRVQNSRRREDKGMGE